MHLVENRLGKWTPPADIGEPFVDIVPKFQTLKTAFDGTNFRHFIYEYLTNKTDEAWTALTSNERFEYRSKYNKQVIAAKTFSLFMDPITPRPKNPMLIQDWKGAVSQKVNDGMKKLRTFIEKTPEIKTNKHDSTITESLMSKKKTFCSLIN